MKRFLFIDGSRARGLRAVGKNSDSAVFATRCDASIGAENRQSAEPHKQPRSPRAASRYGARARALDDHRSDGVFAQSRRECAAGIFSKVKH
jgi:hypothetical protein